MVTLSSGTFETGSAVVLDGDDHVATQMHVALGGRQLKVKTASGQMLDAYIERLDVVKDLATLKVPGLSLSGALPAKLDMSQDNLINRQVFTVGAPSSADGRPICISEGTIQGFTSGRKEFTSTYNPGTAQSAFNAFRFLMDIRFGKEADQFVADNQDALMGRVNEWFDMPQLVSDTVTTDGISGGALVSSAGVEGIVQRGSAKAGTRSSLVSEFIDLENKPSRFTFQYDQSGHRLLAVLPADPSDKAAAAEAGLANIISQTDQRVIDQSAEKPSPR
jgi:hypothetical protein